MFTMKKSRLNVCMLVTCRVFMAASMSFGVFRLFRVAAFIMPTSQTSLNVYWDTGRSILEDSHLLNVSFILHPTCSSSLFHFSPTSLPLQFILFSILNIIHRRARKSRGQSNTLAFYTNDSMSFSFSYCVLLFPSWFDSPVKLHVVSLRMLISRPSLRRPSELQMFSSVP